jgi:hypothetical protein
MKRTQKVSVIAAVAVLGSLAWLGLPSGAHASLIDFGIPDFGEIGFTGTGTGALAVSIPVQGLPAGYQCRPLTDCGGLDLGGATFTADPAGPGTFSIHQVIESFTFTQLIHGVVDTLTGTIHWQFLQDVGLRRASLTGFITISSSSGDAEFVNDFHPGSIATIDLGMELHGTPTLAELALIAGGHADGTIMGAIAPVPEPSSLLLLGSAALIGLGAIARRLGVMT